MHHLYYLCTVEESLIIEMSSTCPQSLHTTFTQSTLGLSTGFTCRSEPQDLQFGATVKQLANLLDADVFKDNQTNQKIRRQAFKHGFVV